MEADEQVSNVSKIFEAFARALVKKENIKIEYLNEEGKITDFTFEINSGTPMFHLAINKNEYIEVIELDIDKVDFNELVKYCEEDVQSNHDGFVKMLNVLQ